MKYIVFILFTVLTNAIAQLMLKQGMMTMGPLTFTLETAVARIFQVVFNPWIFAGIVLFVASLASHLFVLSKVELSFAYPFLSLAYVVVVVFGYFIFAEDLNAWRIAGIGFICLGTILVARSGTDTKDVRPQNTAQLSALHEGAGE
ncbi:hypothetical protein DFR52_101655 [Hoeflea marina]|uniref:Transporter n=1 Tax=Hoeflea marina TaxID=274592 RepID=A0A317PUN4_9HYPH|nr:transporter [Hoeflea marina]PWW03966.1 hypothetical protein DFR52_101655 [Hoeflea marina]